MIALLLLVLGGCSRHPFPTATIEVGATTVEVEVAHTPALREQGLMHRDNLPADRGMLFIYPDEAPRAFWMKNVSFPLDIAFADRTGTIVRIAQMQARTTDTTPSLYPARYALEMNLGWFEAQGIERGDVIRQIPDIEPR